MVAGQGRAGTLRACMLRAAWQTWLGPRASPVDRPVIGSAPDDGFGTLALGDLTAECVVHGEVQPRIYGPLRSTLRQLMVSSHNSQPPSVLCCTACGLQHIKRHQAVSHGFLTHAKRRQGMQGRGNATHHRTGPHACYDTY